MIKRYKTRFTYLTIIFLLTALLQAQFVEDDYDTFTSVGQFGLTVTNFGLLGNGWNRVNGKIQPSSMYKQHTEILREQVEHFSYAGLWLGGIVNNQRRVSTGIVDGVFESGQEGFEFFGTSGVKILSSIKSTAIDSMAQYYSPDAVSHQDLVTDFRDYGVSPGNANGMPNHNPLGIDVHLETYAWNFSFADAFVILDYKITNSSAFDIKNLYGGLWVDASVSNMNYTSRYEPGGGFSWYDNLNGFDQGLDEAGFTNDIGYQYDVDGDDGWAESYIGVKVLGSTTPRPYLRTYYSQWMWNTNENRDYPEYSMPLHDYDRYEALKESVPQGQGEGYTNDGYPSSANSWMFLLSAGPFGSAPLNTDSTEWVLESGESCHIVFAVVAAQWADHGPNTSARRTNLHTNAYWAQRAYDGEDKNRNNRLDPGEDIDDDGEIKRFVLPAPPPTPAMTLKLKEDVVDIYWRNDSEKFIDPITREKDFEGYRIWSAVKTEDNAEKEFTLLAEYDLYDTLHPEIGYNTGLEPVRIKNEDGEQDSVMIGDTYYHYKFSNVGVKSGWLNYYAVSAFDRGDPSSNLESLESTIYSNRKYVIPGTTPEIDWVSDPTVYPNPYRGQAKWDGFGSRYQMIWFRNLPRRAEIRIFTLAGDLIDIIDHDETYDGADVRNIDETKNAQFSGGEHAWDLITKNDQATASGLYLFTVKNLDPQSTSYGDTREGKFLIIK